MKILLIIPPMTQMNTPYPSTAYLVQFLLDQKINATQRDLGLDLFLKIFSRDGLLRIKKCIEEKKHLSEFEEFFIESFNDYENCIGPVIAFLQGKDPTLALRLAKRLLVPEGPRFAPLDAHEEKINTLFGEMGTNEKAKHIASLFLDDLADLIKLSVDEKFEFSRYGESLASSNASFTPLYNSIKKETFIDHYINELTKDYIETEKPDLIGFTLPFPGNVFGAMRSANFIKHHFPHIKIVCGGGFVNTELRELKDTRFFEFFDYLTFDDGERPLLNLIQYLLGNISKSKLVRTWYLENDEIIKSQGLNHDIPFKDLNGPTYSGLKLNQYVSMLELPNPMYRMWSDYRYNKMILAHGCYWKKCTFCDVSLDYIQRYSPQKSSRIIDQIKRIINETGTTGFHFVDEAAPPALIKNLCEDILNTGLKISWWGNLRFDKQFESLAELMADSGCVAVTGGLEVASPRVLSLIEKGTTVEQVARVTKSFSNKGIYVHAYLIYGFPTQTTQETIDSLEIVRQLFQNQCIQSAFWHRFMCTAHSPVGLNPEKYKIKLIPKKSTFAINTVDFIDPKAPDLEMLGEGLRRALYNYMHGIGITADVREWFDDHVPQTTLAKKHIEKILNLRNK